jgi:hypothetical protein
VSTDDLEAEPSIGSVVTDGRDQWERDAEGWWLLFDGGREAPAGPPATWEQLEDLARSSLRLAGAQS